MSETIEVTINGEPRLVPSRSTVAEVVRHLELPTERVAVELNQRVVRRAEWSETPISAGDRLEIVHFVGGG